MESRRSAGDETWFRLREWTKGQAPSERLAAQVLIREGYKSIDPSHPLGGPDGLKDVVCVLNGEKWICATYFPRGEESFSNIKTKYEHDLPGVKSNDAVGIAFITNQELTLSERKELQNIEPDCKLDLFHLERLSTLLNNPAMYGVRLEFLDIEMEKEEQLAFISTYEAKIDKLQTSLGTIQRYFEETGSLNTKKLDEIVSSVSAQQFGKDAPTSPHYVTPNFDNPYMGSRPFSSNLHICSYCKYGFYINDGFGHSPMTVGSYALGYPMGNSSLFSNKTITCPKCGNTEPLRIF